MTFTGPAVVLNECSNISNETGNPNNNFLAFAGSSVPVSESINFAGPQSMLLFSVIGSPTVSVEAMMNETPVSSGSFGFEGSGQTHLIVIQSSIFNNVVISGGGDMQPWALDNFYATPSAQITTVPEPSTFMMLALGLLTFVAKARSTRRRSNVDRFQG